MRIRCEQAEDGGLSEGCCLPEELSEGGSIADATA